MFSQPLYPIQYSKPNKRHSSPKKTGVQLYGKTTCARHTRTRLTLPYKARLLYSTLKQRRTEMKTGSHPHPDKLELNRTALAKNRLMALTAQKIRIACFSGNVWVTWPDCRETTLGPGQRLIIHAKSKICIFALSDADIGLQTERSAFYLRRWFLKKFQISSAASKFLRGWSSGRWAVK